jgi:TolA-binding protein
MRHSLLVELQTQIGTGKMRNERGEYIAQAKEQLDLLNARIVELEAKANEKAGDIRRELKANLRGIRELKNQADGRLERLRLASQPAWEDARRGAEQARKSVADAVEEVKERFQ